jgi:hypothetical protein
MDIDYVISYATAKFNPKNMTICGMYKNTNVYE